MMNFTPSERRAINITIFIILAAGIIQSFQPYVEKNKQYNYTASDSIFSRLTHQYKYSESSPENGHYIVNSNYQAEKEFQSIEDLEDLGDKSGLLELKSINLNTARSEELQRLPRIGPAMARRIIEYRDSTGKFKSIDELIKVKGIGKKTLENIKPYLKI